MRSAIIYTVVILLMSASAAAQGSGKPRSSKATEKLEEKKSDSLPPEVQSTIINKPKIAEETMRRMVGLREAGNPHIQRGEGLLLPGLKDDPAVSSVDLEKLREERIALIERRSPSAALPRTQASTEAAKAAAETAERAGALKAAPVENEQGYFGLALTLASVLLVAGALAYVCKLRL